jgi:hypothetical protein
MKKIQRATGFNLLPMMGGPKQVRLRATTDHPDSSYGLPVWVSAKGECSCGAWALTGALEELGEVLK